MPLKRLSALMLIASALLLSAASGGIGASRNPRSDQSKQLATEQPDSTQQQQAQVVPLSAFQTERAALLEAVRTIEKQAEAERQRATADQETYSSPSVRIQIGLFIV